MTSVSSASSVFTGNDAKNRLFGPLPDAQADAGYEADPPGPRRVLRRHVGVLSQISLTGMCDGNTGQLGAFS